MDTPLRILNVEDSERDSALVERHIKAAGFNVLLKRVDLAEAMKAALSGEEWDLIICDFSMPRFSAGAAMTVLRDSKIDLPFIIISGTVGEETAVEALLSGADDYIPKGNLTRLIPAIQRELVQAENRRAKRTAEEALKESEAELRALFEAMHDVIIVFDYEGHHLKVAPTNPEHFYSRGTKRIGRTVHDIYPADVAEFLLGNIQKCLNEDRTLNLEYTLAIDGNDRWFEGTVTPMTDTSVVWVARDITERKSAEEDLRESEERFAGAFELAPIGVALVLPDGRWLKVNRALCDLLGYSEAEFLNLRFQEITHKDDVEEDIRNRKLLLSGEISRFQIEKRYIHKEGHPVFVRIHGSLVRYESGTPKYFIIQIEDISDRKAHEQQLQLHSLLLNSIGQAVIVTDPAGDITYWNKMAEKMYGWTSREVLGRNIVDIAPTTATRSQGIEILEALKRGKSWSGEFTVQHRNGNHFPILVTNTPLTDAEGNVESIIGISLDVTERKQAEEKLRENESLLSSTQRIAQIGSWVIELSDSGTMVRESWSDEHYRIFGFEPGELEITHELFLNSVHPDDRERIDAALKMASEQGLPFNLEHRINLPDGSERVVHVMAEVFYDSSTGKPTKLLGSVQDITDRKGVEEALRESESRLRTIIETGPECVKLLAADGSLLEMNSAGLRMIEADSFAEVAQRSVYGIIAKQDRKAFRDLTDKVFGGESGMLEFQIVGLKGTHRWLDTHASPLRDGSGKITALLAITRDVTERKQQEEARLASERKYQALVTLAPVGIYQSRRDGSFITANAALANMLGYDTADELLTKNFAEIYFDREKRGQLFDKYEGPGIVTDVDLQLRRKDDSPIWIQLTAHAIKGPNGATEYLEGFVRDITEQKAVEENLRESDEKFHQLADNIDDVFWIRSPDMAKIYYVSPAYEKIWGRPLDSNTGDPNAWHGFIVPGDRQRVKDAYALLMDDAPNIEVEFRIVRADAEIRWVRARGFQVRDAEGSLIRLAGIVTDITDKKYAIEALGESENRFRSVVETAPDVIITIDDSNKIYFINPAGERTFGYGADELRGAALAMLMPERLRDVHENGFQRYLKSGVKMVSWDYVETTGLHKNGREIPITISFSEYEQNGRRYFTGIIRDISDRKQAMEALRESEERYRELVENALDIIYTHDFNGNYTSINKAAETVSGYTKAEVLKLNIAHTIPAEQFEKAKEMIAAKLAGKDITAYELDLVVKDGSTVPIEVNTRIVYENGIPIGVQGIARDITERNRSREALENSERTLRELADELESERRRLVEAQTLAKVGSWHTDLATMKAIWSAETYRIFEVDPATFDPNHQSFLQLVHPEDRDAVEKAFAESLQNDSECVVDQNLLCEINHRLLMDDGSVKFVEERWQMVRDEEGKPYRAIGSSRDITERKLAEQEIDQTMKRLNDAQRIGKIGDWTWDKATDAITWSREVFNIVGRDPELGPPRSYVEMQEYYGIKSWAILDERTALAIETGRAQDYELIVTREDGEHVYAQAMSEPQFDDTGEICGLRGTLQDISSRRAAETALRESEFRYHSLFENMIEGYAYCQTIFEEDKLVDWVYTEVNGAFEALTGMKDVVGKRISELIPGGSEIHPEIFETYGRVASTGRTERLETYIEPLNRWLAITLYSSNREHFVGVFDNITERKLAEARLTSLKEQTEKRERMLTTMLSSMSDFAQIYDPEGRIIFVNQPVLDLWGRTLDDVVGKTFHDMGYPAEMATKLERQIKQVYRSKMPITDEALYMGVSGNLDVYEYILSPAIDGAGDVDFVVGLTRDVTERKKAEASLRSAEEKYRSIFENAVEGIFQSTPDGKFVSVNPAMARILGYESPAELMADRTETGSQYYVDPSCRAEIERRLAETGTVVGFACEVRRKDGSSIWIIENIRAIRDESGAVILYEGSLEDITERKRGEEVQGRRTAHAALRADISAALAQSHIPLRSTLERCTQAMVQHLDAAFARIWTLNARDNVLELQASAGIYTHTDGPHGKVPVGQFKIGRIAADRQPHVSNNVENDPRVSDKEWASREGMVAFAGYPLIMEDRLVGVVAMFTRQTLPDDTLDGLAAVANIMSHGIERKHAEEALRASEDQLRQSQKMEAVGVMAGGIAHDFNNLLTAISGYSDLSLRKMPQDEPLRRNIEEVKKAADRAAELTSQLLAFSRKQVLMPVVHNLNSVIETIEKMLRRIMRENIELRTVLEADLGNIKADPGQIEQVIMNLAVNARDAMADGGILTIETQNVYLDDDYVSQKLAIRTGRFVRMTVADTGVGMDESTQQHIFEPFFTTKDVGQGTGLGLSMVYGIVKQSGGDIMVYSEPGYGTTFKIYLPCVDEPVERPRRSRDYEATYSGSETILVVEDEEIVRSLVREILTSSGYLVLEAASGEKALEICSNYSEPIHLLLTDVIMPKMGGSELRAQVAKLLPDIKVLFMSGYTDDTITHRSISESKVAFIEKPFTPDALTRKVREELER